MKKVGVAILGLGAVGGEVYGILKSQREFFQRTQHADLSVESVLEPCTKRLDELGVPQQLRATNIAEVVANPDVNLIVECIGGAEAALEYCLDTLKVGKTVVTANPELYAKYSHELELAAKRHNAGLYFGGSVLGGAPIVRLLLDGLQSSMASSLVAVGYSDLFGGTSKEDLGAFELSTLASLAFHTKVAYAQVTRGGSSTYEDVADAAALGYRIKEVAIAKNTQEGIEVRVCPALVAKESPLAPDGAHGVRLTGGAAGEVVLLGGGTAAAAGSAVVSDIIYAATHEGNRYSTFENTEQAKETRIASDPTGAYFLRVATDAAGAAKIVSALSKQGIAVQKYLLCGAAGKEKLLLVTCETRYSIVQAALEKAKASADLIEVV